MSHAFVVPRADVRRALERTGFEALLELPAFADADRATVDELLDAFGRFAVRELLPLDAVGDRIPSRLVDGRVVSPPGFRAFYDAYVRDGWGAVPFPASLGGGGMPWTVGVAMQETLCATNVAFSLCPMLTQAGVELFQAWGTAAQRERYLPKLLTGEWTSTMVLTEPDAGSDVGAVRATAEQRPDGTWAISGTKIFITWGDHDLTDGLVHAVLAKAPGAPPGTAGISLFVVPSHVDGERNAVRVLSLEHKMGLHASPTAALAFEGATGELVGELHGGMKVMFTMMNRARLSVGVQGLGLSERAYQAALAYACQRTQGRRPGSARSVAIVEHPDIRRQLLAMRADIDAMRLLVYATANAIDRATHLPDGTERDRAGALAALLVPLSKAWPTDVVNDITSAAIQIHGGAGYIEETGVAQMARDARISSIYEGTNGIQAIDLVMRKVAIGDADPLAELLHDLATTADALRAKGEHEAGDELAAAGDAVGQAAAWIVEARGERSDEVLAVATEFLDLTARTVAGSLLAGELLDGEPRRAVAARWFLTRRLGGGAELLRTIRSGPGDLLDLDLVGLVSR